MGHPVKRTHKKRANNFVFTTRSDAGITRDTAEQRAEKERLVAEYLKNKGESRGTDS